MTEQQAVEAIRRCCCPAMDAALCLQIRYRIDPEDYCRAVDGECECACHYEAEDDEDET